MQLVFYLDESGQLANKKRKRAVIGGYYYVVHHDNTNIINHTILRTSRKIQRNFKKQKFGLNKQKWPSEIKGYLLSLEDREYFFKTFLALNVQPAAVLLEKHRLEKKESFLSDENLFFNYLVKLLINSVLRDKNFSNLTKIHIFYDQRSVKPKSANSLQDYLNVYFRYEENLETVIVCQSRDSHTCTQTQCADIIVNTIFARFHDRLKKDYPLDFRKMIDRNCKILRFPLPVSVDRKIQRLKEQKKLDKTLDFQQKKA